MLLTSLNASKQVGIVGRRHRYWGPVTYSVHRTHLKEEQIAATGASSTLVVDVQHQLSFGTYTAHTDPGPPVYVIYRNADSTRCASPHCGRGTSNGTRNRLSAILALGSSP